MKGELGYFTSYGIEYVVDFLGEDRIVNRISELEGKATMGITLKEFTYKDPKYCYYSDSGVLNVLTDLLEWFSDFDFISYLFMQSKKYNPENYFEGGLLPSLRADYLEALKFTKNSSPDMKLYCEIHEQNPYWKGYHFFYLSLSKKLKKASREGVPVDALLVEVFDSYIINFEEITNAIRIDNSLYENSILSNGVLFDAFDYYESKGKQQKAESIALLNNKYPDVWSEIQIDSEEE